MMDTMHPDMRRGRHPPRSTPTPWHARPWVRPALVALVVLAALLAAAVLWLAEQGTLQP